MTDPLLKEVQRTGILIQQLEKQLLQAQQEHQKAIGRLVNYTVQQGMDDMEVPETPEPKRAKRAAEPTLYLKATLATPNVPIFFPRSNGEVQSGFVFPDSDHHTLCIDKDTLYVNVTWNSDNHIQCFKFVPWVHLLQHNEDVMEFSDIIEEVYQDNLDTEQRARVNRIIEEQTLIQEDV